MDSVTPGPAAGGPNAVSRPPFAVGFRLRNASAVWVFLALQIPCRLGFPLASNPPVCGCFVDLQLTTGLTFSGMRIRHRVEPVQGKRCAFLRRRRLYEISGLGGRISVIHGESLQWRVTLAPKRATLVPGERDCSGRKAGVCRRPCAVWGRRE